VRGKGARAWRGGIGWVYGVADMPLGNEAVAIVKGGNDGRGADDPPPQLACRIASATNKIIAAIHINALGFMTVISLLLAAKQNPVSSVCSRAAWSRWPARRMRVSSPL